MHITIFLEKARVQLHSSLYVAKLSYKFKINLQAQNLHNTLQSLFLSGELPALHIDRSIDNFP